MSATYWIKLYHEILDDPKMATLPARLWRRVIELFLCAGRYDKNGDLPDISSIAWMLRISLEDAEVDLQQLALTGIVEKNQDGWRIPKFAARQAASTSTQRSQEFRKRRRQHQYNGDATDLQRNDAQIRSDTDQNRTEINIIEGEDEFSKMQHLCERLVGRPAIPGDIATINKFIKEGVIENDISEGIAWRIANKLKPVTSISQIEGATLFNKAARIQAATAKRPMRSKPGTSNPKADRNDPAVTTAMREELISRKNDKPNMAE